MERHPAITPEEQAQLDALGAECKRLDDIEYELLEKMERAEVRLEKMREKLRAMQPECEGAYAERDELWEDLKLAGQEV